MRLTRIYDGVWGFLEVDGGVAVVWPVRGGGRRRSVIPKEIRVPNTN